MKSWKTTAVGIAGFFGALGHALAALWDADPATEPQWKLVGVAAMAMVGLFFARDNDKSSEDVGTK